MTYDEDDERLLREAEAEMAPVDAVVDELLRPMIEAFIRMRFHDGHEVPTWELSAEGAHVGMQVSQLLRQLDESEMPDVLFCTLGRLAALSVRYTGVLQELRRKELDDPA